jgi:hypothetical protein
MVALNLSSRYFRRHSLLGTHNYSGSKVFYNLKLILINKKRI